MHAFHVKVFIHCAVQLSMLTRLTSDQMLMVKLLSLTLVSNGLWMCHQLPKSFALYHRKGWSSGLVVWAMKHVLLSLAFRMAFNMLQSSWDFTKNLFLVKRYIYFCGFRPWPFQYDSHKIWEAYAGLKINLTAHWPRRMVDGKNPSAKHIFYRPK